MRPALLRALSQLIILWYFSPSYAHSETSQSIHHMIITSPSSEHPASWRQTEGGSWQECLLWVCRRSTSLSWLSWMSSVWWWRYWYVGGAIKWSMIWMCAGDQTKMITTPIYILIRWPAEPVCGVEVRGEASWGGGDTDNCSSDQVHHEWVKRQLLVSLEKD